MNEKKQPVGVIGLGNAGLALATPLLRKFDVVGYDRDPERARLAQEIGLRVAENAINISRDCEIILLSLPTPAASLAAARELAQGDLQGRLVIETSTVGPHDVDALGALLAPYGAALVDSAIIGGIHKLAEGKTTFLVGASARDYKRAQPVLKTAAEDIFHLGEVGSGMRAKLVNNAIAHTTMVMLMEGAALAAKAGVPIDVFYTLMRRESGLMRPLTHRFGERIRQQNFEGGMPTANARKDSSLALELGRDLGVPLFTLQASHAVYEIACSHGLGRYDYSSISKLWEGWLDIDFGSTKDE